MSPFRSIFRAGALFTLLMGLGLAGCRDGQRADTSDDTSSDAKSADSSRSDDYVVGQQPVTVTGANLVDYDNARINCDYSYIGKTSYATHCDLMVQQANGQQVKATAIKEGVSIQWRDPQIVEGKVNFEACQAAKAGLSYICNVTATDTGSATQVKYGIAIASGERKPRTESQALVLPYSVGITLGFVPGMPIAVQAQSTNNAAFLRTDFAGNAVDFFKPGPICVRGNRVFFAHGLFVYVWEQGRVRIFAGSGNLQDTDKAANKEHVYLNPGSLACTKDWVYVLSSYIYRIHRVADDGRVEILAGTGLPKVSPDGVMAKDSSIGDTSGFAVDEAGQVYFGEDTVVRTILPNGVLNTFAGDGGLDARGDGGPAVKASLRQISGIVTGALGVFIVDSAGAAVRRVGKDGIITTVAGTGVPRYKDPTDRKALAEPSGIAIDQAGNLYIGEYYRGIKKLGTDGKLTQYISAGEDIPKFFGEAVRGQWSSALVEAADLALFNNRPAFTKIAVGADGTVYLNGVHGILAYAPGAKDGVPIAGFSGRPKSCSAVTKGHETTLVEAAAIAYAPNGHLQVLDWLALDSDQMLLRDTFELNQAQVVKNIAGCEQEPWLVGRNLLNYRRGYNVANDLGGLVVAPDGSAYVANQNLGAIFKVPPDGQKSLVAGKDASTKTTLGKAKGTPLDHPTSLALAPDGSLYVLELSGELSPSEPVGSRIQKISPDGSIRIVVGDGTTGDAGDGGLATAARLSAAAIAVAADGRLFIADFSNNKVKMVDKNGLLTTIAGNGESDSAQEDGLVVDARSASIFHPVGIAVTNDGTVFVTTFGTGQVKQLQQRADGGWNLSNFFGKASTSACGVARASGLANSQAVDQSIQNSMSVLCNGRPRAIAIKDTCPSLGGSTRIAFSQMFDKYVNVVEVVKPCGDVKK